MQINANVDVLLIVTAFLAGAINSVAGGGTFLTFPALMMAGITPIAANVASSIAVFPGQFASAYAYREDFKKINEIPMVLAIITSLIGGWIGSAVLLVTPENVFVDLIPWLMLSATMLFAFGKQAGELLRKKVKIGPVATTVLLLSIGLYGGYFGAGIGILTLALFGLLGLTDINKMNAIKTILTGAMNVAAVGNFLTSTNIYWHGVILMSISAIIGGYIGAAVARKVEQRCVKWTVILIGTSLTIYFFFFHK